MRRRSSARRLRLEGQPHVAASSQDWVLGERSANNLRATIPTPIKVQMLGSGKSLVMLKASSPMMLELAPPGPSLMTK